MEFKAVFKELLIVIIGVFIGMLLNSWNEGWKARKEADRYLQGIQEEMLGNIEKLKEGIPYHQKLLAGLREDPTNVRLVLNATPVSDLAWKLSENNTFKNNIDKDIYYKIAQVYQYHDNLVSIQDQAGDRMSELNVIGPFYQLQLIDKDIDAETMKEIEESVIQGWIPIFESWTSFEQQYLDALKTVVQELDGKASKS
ncbi:MAG: hypothetical protein AAFV95_12870 [Bacteroidota bacterium]